VTFKDGPSSSLPFFFLDSLFLRPRLPEAGLLGSSCELSEEKEVEREQQRPVQ
jgi:hypothetical protein